MRLLPFAVVASVLAAVVFVSLVFTGRGLILHDREVIVHVGEIKQPADFDLGKVLDDYGVHLVIPPSLFDLATNNSARLAESYSAGREADATPPAAGRSIREFAFLGMPFGWTTGMGDVIYARKPREVIYAQLNSRGSAALEAANGGNVFERGFFPFWAHSWGWLWVIGVLVAVWLWFRAEAQRREAIGEI